MLQLICHPKTPADNIVSVSAGFELSSNGLLKLKYSVEAPVSMILAPELQDPLRTDDLWKTTCFEAFLAIPDAPEYLELNFSPSSQWAAYHFSEIRKGRTDLILPIAPEISLNKANNLFVLEAAVQLPVKWQNRELAAGLNAIAEETGGTKSYWALDHKKDEPDFHDLSCFTAQLKATEQP